jgi:hypothetical protein
MKKLYIKPQTEVEVTQIESLLAGHSNDFVGAKEQNVEDVKEKKPLEDLEFRNICDEEEEE